VMMLVFEIDKLGGFPGLKSQRWLDEVGNALNKITTRDGSGGGKVTGNQKREATLSLLDDSTGNRKAKFKCTLALIDNTNTVKNISIGDVDLLIASKARGASKQDYDPIIIPVEGDGRTFAEMSTQEKNSFSHRGKAAKKLKIYIDKLKQ